jgi:hypothetical protein
MTDTQVTQVSIEEFASANPPAQVTQVTIEQWVTTATVTGQALVTQVALEQWVPAGGPPIDLAGNLGGISHYGTLKYGLGKYSRINAFAPIFGGDLDVHISLVDLGGDLAPQIALGGSLSLDLPLTVLEGGLTPIVVLGASSFVVKPFWEASEPCPSLPWAESELCPPSMWTPIGPCDSVEWKKSELCNG